MSKKSDNKMQKKQEMIQKSQKNRQMRLLMITTGVIVVLLFVGFAFYSQYSTPEQAESGLAIPYEGQPTLGKADAPIRIAELGDFKCPSCKAFTDEIFPLLQKEYIDTGIASFTYLNYPIISPDSYTAAEASEAVFNQKPEAFWPYYKALYREQGPEHEAWATPEFLVNLAKKENLELDYDQLDKDIRNQTYKQHVQQEYAFADKAGIGSTPTLFINGKEVDKVFDYQAIKAMIEAERKAQSGNGQN